MRRGVRAKVVGQEAKVVTELRTQNRLGSGKIELIRIVLKS